MTNLVTCEKEPNIAFTEVVHYLSMTLVRTSEWKEGLSPGYLV